MGSSLKRADWINLIHVPGGYGGDQCGDGHGTRLWPHGSNPVGPCVAHPQRKNSAACGRPENAKTCPEVRFQTFKTNVLVGTFMHGWVRASVFSCLWQWAVSWFFTWHKYWEKRTCYEQPVALCHFPQNLEFVFVIDKAGFLLSLETSDGVFFFACKDFSEGSINHCLPSLFKK